jgi:hypothetical protein
VAAEESLEVETVTDTFSLLGFGKRFTLYSRGSHRFSPAWQLMLAWLEF